MRRITRQFEVSIMGLPEDGAGGLLARAEHAGMLA